jgi:hypothetical protein
MAKPDVFGTQSTAGVKMRIILLSALALLNITTAWAQTPTDAAQFSGQARLQWIGQQASDGGPLAQANALQSGTAALPANSAALETELRLSGRGLSSVVTLQQQQGGNGSSHGRGWVNELYASHDGGAWQFSAGKKIVSWDVGYGFRPNDIIQQEERRTLISATQEGRPLLMAEYFGVSSAWSWVWVNPTASSDARGAGEPALALRFYRRDGAVDWHGFARAGAHTGASVGVAAAWVASEALELHGSMRYMQRADSLTSEPNPQALVANNPWRASTEHEVKQILIGGTWTHENQLSLLAEAWWDGSAPSDASWQRWTERNRQLAALATQGAPAAAVAGNLAWQAQGFNVSPNLRRGNLFLRLSWQHDAWQPALDLLITPADGGRIATASIIWQGDRVQVQGGLRTYGGSTNAAVMQLPAHAMTYVASTWAF